MLLEVYILGANICIHYLLTLVLSTLMKTGWTVVLQRRTALAISTCLTSHTSLGRNTTACISYKIENSPAQNITTILLGI